MPYREQTNVTKLADLPFGEGRIGARERLPDSLAESEFAEQLHARTEKLTQTNLADCIDGRLTVRLMRTSSGLVLVERVVNQLPGGTYLAATKAVLAANAQVVADAKSMQDAYEKVARVLTGAGEEDAAHAGCGAEEKAELSVERPIDPETLLATFRLLVGDNPRLSSTISNIGEQKRQLLENGLYSSWQPTWHADFVASNFPENYSYLESDNEDETNGHHEAGLYVITKQGQGFAKNAFIESTGRQAFAVTVPKMRQLADLLGGSDEEKARIFYAFIDDALHVSNVLVAKGLPVFVDSAEG